MIEFFFTLKKRIGLGGAIMLFGIFRVAPFLLVAAFAPLFVWRGEWLSAVMCLLLGFVTMAVGVLMEARAKEALDAEASKAQSAAAVDNMPPVTVAVSAGSNMHNCAMPECKRNVEMPKHPLCPECWTDWINQQAQNVFHCAMPGCKNTATSAKRPLCRLCWGKWDKANRSQ